MPSAKRQLLCFPLHLTSYGTLRVTGIWSSVPCYGHQRQSTGDSINIFANGCPPTFFGTTSFQHSGDAGEPQIIQECVFSPTEEEEATNVKTQQKNA